jgi:hypothetical protein
LPSDSGAQGSLFPLLGCDIVELRPGALQILERHLALHARLKLEGKINHEELFFRDDGAPIRNLQYPWFRWRRTLTVTLKGRYREPYNAPHSSLRWNLMIGKNPLWVAKQHGHSVQTMLETYARLCSTRQRESVSPAAGGNQTPSDARQHTTLANRCRKTGSRGSSRRRFFFAEHRTVARGPDPRAPTAES